MGARLIGATILAFGLAVASSRYPSAVGLGQESGLAGTPQTQLSPDAFRGEFLFFQRCSLCHLEISKGGPVPAVGPSLNGVLTDGSAERGQKVRDQIRNGSSRMPGFNYGLTAKQLDQLIAYLKTLK